MSSAVADARAGATTVVDLDAAQYTALWRHLGLGDKPVLLDTPDHGATRSARDAADARALVRLRDAGLVDAADRVRVDLADALAVLRASWRELDVRIWSAGTRRGWLAAERGDLVVLAGLDAAGGLRLRTGPFDDLAAAALTEVPASPALPGVPVTVPADAVLGVADPEQRSRRLRAAGVGPVASERLRTLWAEPPLRVLQFGAAVRDEAGRRHRAGRPLTVVDAVPGRVLLRRTGRRLAVRPVDTRRLHTELRALLDGLRWADPQMT